MATPADPFGLLGGLALPPPARLDRPAAADTPPPWEACAECGGAMGASPAAAGDFVCLDCGAEAEGPDGQGPADTPARTPVRAAPRYRVVGAESGYYQRGLDSGSVTDPRASAHSQLFRELQKWNRQHENQGGRPFAEVDLQAVADHFMRIREHEVRRSEQKRCIISGLLWYVCAESGFARKGDECARFAQLRVDGIARGKAQVRRFAEDRVISIKINPSYLCSIINMIFVQLGMGNDDFGLPRGLRLPGRVREPALLLEAAVAVVERAEQKNVGVQSVQRSKAVGASLEVLRRAGALEPGGGLISAGYVAERCRVRKNTIMRFVNELERHGQLLREVYADFGLAEPEA